LIFSSTTLILSLTPYSKREVYWILITSVYATGLTIFGSILKDEKLDLNLKLCDIIKMPLDFMVV